MTVVQKFLTVKSIKKPHLFPVVKCTTNEDVATLKNSKYAQLDKFSRRKRIENRTSDQEGVAHLSVLDTET